MEVMEKAKREHADSNNIEYIKKASAMLCERLKIVN